jgi:hypothetical protein
MALRGYLQFALLEKEGKLNLKKYFCSTLLEFENFLLCERISILSQLVKTKRQANFKGFKRFGASKGLVEQKNVAFNSFVCKLGLFWQFTHELVK